MDCFYRDAGSIFVQAYDALCTADLPAIAGDAAFYAGIARDAGGAVLEVACGTGRIALALAEAGFEVTGVDRSDGMLSIARRKAASLPVETQRRLAFVRQDMSELRLDRDYSFAFVAFRSFQHLLTTELQVRTLHAIRRHLEPAGSLALHVFDPRLDLLVDETLPIPGQSGTDETTGRRYVSEIIRTRFDHLAQTRHDLWRCAEIGADGGVLREDTGEMALRWTYRWELRHLLALCGFTVEAEYSDFRRSAPVYGKELIVVARAR